MGDHNVSGSGQPNRRGGRKRALNEDNLTEEEKARKQKNRDAAKKCRQRKIEEAVNLKQQNEDLENQNKELTKRKSFLEMKIKECLNVIHEHRLHGCHLPDEVIRMLEGENYSYSPDTHVDFFPVGTHTTLRSSNASSVLHQNEPLSIQTMNLNKSAESIKSKIPTGLFSGTHIQIDQNKSQKGNLVVKSQSGVMIAQDSNQERSSPYTDSEVTIQSPFKVAWTPQSGSTVNHNGYEEGDGQSPTSSPVQRVPNIDQIQLSPHSSKLNVAEDSGDDEYHPTSGMPLFLPHQQHVNVNSAFINTFSNENTQLNLNNANIQPSQNNFNQFTQSYSKLVNLENAANPLMSRQSFLNSMVKLKNTNNHSVSTQSMQATAELISQAIQHIQPSEISETLQAQIAECANQPETISSSVEEDVIILDSENNTDAERAEMEAKPQHQFEYVSKMPLQQQLEVIQQTNEFNPDSKISVPVASVSGIQNGFSSNIFVSNSVSGGTVTQYGDCPQTQTYVSIDIDGQLTLVPVQDISALQPQPSSQASQSVDESVHQSQIPTTVLEESAAPSQIVNGVVRSSQAIESTEISETVTNTPSITHYSQVLSDLPSLSFNDLKNQPKEIFEKKPSRLLGKTTK